MSTSSTRRGHLENPGAAEGDEGTEMEFRCTSGGESIAYSLYRKPDVDKVFTKDPSLVVEKKHEQQTRAVRDIRLHKRDFEAYGNTNQGAVDCGRRERARRIASLPSRPTPHLERNKGLKCALFSIEGYFELTRNKNIGQLHSQHRRKILAFPRRVYLVGDKNSKNNGGQLHDQQGLKMGGFL